MSAKAATRGLQLKERSELYGSATTIMEREYSSNISLDELARKVSASNRQLSQAFSQIGRTTFKEKLTKIRMRRAAELLSRSTMDITEIARRVGYRQTGQFTRTFREYIGISPIDYRRLNSRNRTFSWPRSWH